MKDPTEWRKKFNAWKNGTPTSELFNLPKYDYGTDDNPWIPKNTKVSTKNSEPVSAKPTTAYIGDRNQPEETEPKYTEPINPQTGRPYTIYEKDLPLSGTDPIGEMVVEGAASGPLFEGLGWVGKQAVKQAMPYLGRALKPYTNYFAAKVLSNAINDAARNPLNKSNKTAIFPIESDNFPGHRIHMRRPPRQKINPKNLTDEELVLHWNRIVNDLSIDKKAPQEVIDLFDNADLPKTAKSGVYKFVLPDPNDPQYVFKRFRSVEHPSDLKRYLEDQAILNSFEDLIVPTEYIGSKKISDWAYIPYFRQRAIKSLDGKDAVLAGKDWQEMEDLGTSAFYDWFNRSTLNPKYSTSGGRVITKFGGIGDIGTQHNIGIDETGTPFAFDPMLFDRNSKETFDYLYGPILYDKGKSIHINPANKGKFKKNIKIPK